MLVYTLRSLGWLVCFVAFFVRELSGNTLIVLVGQVTMRLGVVLVLATASFASVVDPAPPSWPNKFMFVANVYQKVPIDPNFRVGSMQYYYDYSIPAVRQVFTNPAGLAFAEVHTQNNAWRIRYLNTAADNETSYNCCLCEDPFNCGHVPPPNPSWLKNGVYLGVETINDRKCQGWGSNVPGFNFTWYTSLASNTPCRMQFSPYVDFVISMFSTDESLIPSSLFAVPKLCPFIADPTVDCQMLRFPSTPPRVT